MSSSNNNDNNNNSSSNNNNITTTNPRKKKKRKLSPLSPIQTLFLSQYDALDATMIFLNRRKVITAVDTVCRTLSSIIRQNFSDNELFLLCGIAPKLFLLEWVIKPEPGVEDYQVYSDLNVTSSTNKIPDTLMISFVGKTPKKKRRKLFMDALRIQLSDVDDRSNMKNIIVPPKPVALANNNNNIENDFRTSFVIDPPNYEIDVKNGGVLEYLKNNEKFYKNQIKNIKVYPSKEAEYGKLEVQLIPPLLNAIKNMGINKLYTHQTKGINAAMNDGSHVVISTSTSSGKSLVYNIPVLQEIMMDEDATAIYLFPTKSLSHDQAAGLKTLSETIRTSIATTTNSYHLGTNTILSLDGDTNKLDRIKAKDHGRIILTNPDMLHYTLLPQHDTYKRILRGCKYVVIDEGHVYKGAFGAHTTCVLRRLVRLCLSYGSSPQFICCSATIANPLDHFEELVPVQFLPKLVKKTYDGSNSNSNDNKDNNNIPVHNTFEAISNINGTSTTRGATASRDVCVITSIDDGSPRGERQFIMWNPPLFHENLDSSASSTTEEEKETVHRERQPYRLPSNFHTMTARQKRDARLRMVRDQPERKSSIFETASLLAFLVSVKVRTLAFVKVRKLTELVAKYTKDILLNNSHTPNLANDVCSYRAGYLPEHRKELEKRIFNQEMVGIASTNALELGINIGNLDSVILLGFPGSISSLWQQAGRAGRKDRPAAIFFVAFDSPIDQFFMSNPEKLYNKKVENAVVEANNPYVLKMHLLCAARELPLTNDDTTGLQRINDIDLFGGKQNVMNLINEHIAPGNMIKIAPTLYGVHPSIDIPSRGVNIRSIDNVTITVLHGVTNMPIDRIEQFRSYWEVHPGAIYMNQGVQFTIIKLDLDQHIAIAKPSNVKYFTSCRDHTDVNTMDRVSRSPTNSTNAYYGRVSICTSVWGYRKQWLSNSHIFETVPLTLPPIEYSSFGVWVDIPSTVVNFIETNGCDFLGSIHGANHILLHCLPLFVSCDRTDCGTECPSIYQERARPLRLILYDAHPGGIGVCKRVLPLLTDLVEYGYELASSCKCKTGCPSCVLDVRCAEYNDVVDKKGAIFILKVVLEQLKSGEEGL